MSRACCELKRKLLINIRVACKNVNCHLSISFLFFCQSQQPDTPMSSGSTVTKQELNTGMPISISSQSSTSHTRSKPQACKVCGKMLSSASSYYVHMKLHSGTKPFSCTVSMYSKKDKRNSNKQLNYAFSPLTLCILFIWCTMYIFMYNVHVMIMYVAKAQFKFMRIALAFCFDVTTAGT